jgi:hypothetical protein
VGGRHQKTTELAENKAHATEGAAPLRFDGCPCCSTLFHLWISRFVGFAALWISVLFHCLETRQRMLEFGTSDNRAGDRLGKAGQACYPVCSQAQCLPGSIPRINVQLSPNNANLSG